MSSCEPAGVEFPIAKILGGGAGNNWRQDCRHSAVTPREHPTAALAHAPINRPVSGCVAELMPACANERRIGAVRQLNAGCKLADTPRRAAAGQLRSYRGAN